MGTLFFWKLLPGGSATVSGIEVRQVRFAELAVRRQSAERTARDRIEVASPQCSVVGRNGAAVGAVKARVFEVDKLRARVLLGAIDDQMVQPVVGVAFVGPIRFVEGLEVLVRSDEASGDDGPVDEESAPEVRWVRGGGERGSGLRKPVLRMAGAGDTRST